MQKDWIFKFKFDNEKKESFFNRSQIRRIRPCDEKELWFSNSKEVEKYYKEFEKDFKEKTWKNFLTKDQEIKILKKSVLKSKNLLVKINEIFYEKWENYNEFLEKNMIETKKDDNWNFLNENEKIIYFIEKKFFKEI